MAEEIAPYLDTFSQYADCWYASVRPDGRPHIAPIWFVWVENAVWMMTTPKAVRAHNLATSDRASVAAPDTASPFILEGRSEQVVEPPEAVRQAFLAKYKWQIGIEEPEYVFLIRFSPEKALTWQTSGEGSHRWRYQNNQWHESDK